MWIIVNASTLRTNGLTRQDDPIEGMILIPVPEGFDIAATADYRWDDVEEEFVLDPLPPPPPTNLAALKVERKAALADRRWQAETAGTTIAGMPIATDERSQAKIAGAALQAVINPGYSVQWKTGAGFVTLDATMVIGVAQAVRAHIQACFDREAELVAEIDAATTTAALGDIDINAGWPV